MSLAFLLNPRSDEDPSGSDLEYDSAFTALERASQTVPERQVGGEIVPAEEPDFALVAIKANEILERSHDLRAAVWLTQAKLRLEGFEGFVAGLELISGMLSQWWDSCHPQLDAEDGNDPTARVNAVRGLTDPDTTLRGVLLTPLSQSTTFGRITLRDVLIASGEMTAVNGVESTADAAAIAAALRDTDTAILTARHAALQDSRRYISEINRIFDKETPGFGPDFAQLDRYLRRALSRLSEVVGDGEAEDTAGAEAGEAVAGTETGAAPRAQSAPGTISSIADVRMAMDRIIAYYNEKEPSSPMPILLNRARRLIGADFMTIMRDIAPGGIDHVRVLGGISEDEK